MGIGLRILFDGRTIYSFTNQISKEALLNLAKTMSRAIKEETEGQRIDLTHRERSAISSHQILNPPSAIEKHPRRAFNWRKGVCRHAGKRCGPET